MNARSEAASKRQRILLVVLAIVAIGSGVMHWLARNAPPDRPPNRIVMRAIDGVWIRLGGLEEDVVTDIIADPDNPDAVYVAGQGGSLTHVVVQEPHRDHTTLRAVAHWGADLGVGAEMGLLGLTFGDHDGERVLYTSFTDPDRRSIVARVPWTSDGPLWDERVGLLAIDQPYTNHNGGQIRFGPDGYLYLGLGDGGSADDPEGNGQNRSTPLGAILRLDVTGDEAVAPSDNPFFDEPDVDPRIFVYGLRNPWRYDFDPNDDALWIADVGQREVEEVTRVPFAAASGANLGWANVEGDQCFSGDAEACADPSLVAPGFTYSHEAGCSVTGGVVVRDTRLPEVRGRFLAADLCNGQMWALTGSGDRFDVVEAGSVPIMITAFGTDGAGRTWFGSTDGSLYRLEPR